MALAQAATQRFALGRVLFVPANVPPHKQKQPLAAFVHRYAMVALGTREERRFTASLLEAGSEPQSEEANYSIDTVRRLKQTLKKSDRLFFLIGIDAFKDIASWHEARALLGECDFIVASRPGHSLRDVALALPEELQPAAARALQKQAVKGDLIFPGVGLHLLDGVRQSVSATAIRAAAAQGKALTRWVDPMVADYIRKHGLYRKGA